MPPISKNGKKRPASDCMHCSSDQSSCSFFTSVAFSPSFFSQNLIEKPSEKEVVQENALAMIQCKVMKQLEVLEGQKIEDEDIAQDIEYLNDKLVDSMQDLRYV